MGQISLHNRIPALKTRFKNLSSPHVALTMGTILFHTSRETLNGLHAALNAYSYLRIFWYSGSTTFSGSIILSHRMVNALGMRSISRHGLWFFFGMTASWWVVVASVVVTMKCFCFWFFTFLRSFNLTMNSSATSPNCCDPLPVFGVIDLFFLLTLVRFLDMFAATGCEIRFLVFNAVPNIR